MTRINFREKGFIWAHGLKESSPAWETVEGSSVPHPARPSTGNLIGEQRHAENLDADTHTVKLGMEGWACPDGATPTTQQPGMCLLCTAQEEGVGSLSETSL